MNMKRLLSLIRRRERTPPPRRPVTPAERAQTAAAVRQQEHYNFLHYDGDVQPDPVETTQI